MKKKLSNKDTGLICSEMAYMLRAGVYYSDVLNIMAAEPGNNREILAAMACKADEGAEMHEIFKAAEAFPEYVVKMVSLGERSGRLEESLNSLSEYYDKRCAFESRLKTTLTYPAVLLVVMLAVIIVLLVYVLPVFNDVYAQFGSALTGTAGILLSAGRVMGRIMPAVMTVLALIAVAVTACALSEKLRSFFLGKLQLHFGDKGIIGRLNKTRFIHALSMCMKSGLPAGEAVSLAATVVSDIKTMNKICEKCIELTEHGESMPAALEKSGLLTSADCRLLAAGQRSGTEDAAISRIAERMERDSDEALERTAGSIEPALVVITSLVIGMILVSVMLPLMNIMSAVG